MFYVLMSGKSAKNYRAVFDYIEENLFKLEPDQFLTDFEAGMRKAIRLCYPSAILLGCWFHYCSAVRRKVIKLRLYRLIAENQNARAIYRKLLSWPLLPQNNMEEGYEVILAKANRNRLMKTFKKLFKYFEEFWLKQVFQHLHIYPQIHVVFKGEQGIGHCWSMCSSVCFSCWVYI